MPALQGSKWLVSNHHGCHTTLATLSMCRERVWIGLLSSSLGSPKTANGVLCWGVSVGKCQVSASQFWIAYYQRSRRDYFGYGMIKSQTTAWGQLSGQGIYPFSGLWQGPALPPADREGLPTWSSCSPLAVEVLEKGGGEFKLQEEPAFQTLLMSTCPSSKESEPTKHICLFRMKNFVIKSCTRQVRLELAFYILSESENLSSSGIGKPHVIA